MENKEVIPMDEATLIAFHRLERSIEAMNPTLAKVIKWHSSNGRDRDSMFMVKEGTAFFAIFGRGEKVVRGYWNLDHDELERQDRNLILWLADLI